MYARPAHASIAAQPEQLQGTVLERERLPVKQLQQPFIWPELTQRRDRNVIKGGIRACDQRA